MKEDLKKLFQNHKKFFYGIIAALLGLIIITVLAEAVEEIFDWFF